MKKRSFKQSLLALVVLASTGLGCSSIAEERSYLGQTEIVGNSCSTTPPVTNDLIPEPPSPAPESQTTIIFAAQSWQAFPMTVEVGDLLQIQSTGEWNGGQGWCGAAGCNGTGPSFDESSYCFAENDCVVGLKNLLIMKIVSDEDRLNSPDNNPQMGEEDFESIVPIKIAKDFESESLLFEVTKSGRLYFRNSDGDQGLYDNSGGLYVTVTKR